MCHFKKYVLWAGLAIFMIVACVYWWTGLVWQNPPQKEGLQFVSGNLVGIEYREQPFGRSSAPDEHPKSFITLKKNGEKHAYTLFFLKALGDYSGCGPRLQKGSQTLNSLPQGTRMEFLVKEDIIWQIKAADRVLMAYEDLREYSKIKGEETVFWGCVYFFSCIGLTFYYWAKGELI